MAHLSVERSPGRRALRRVLADAYIHDLGENEAAGRESVDLLPLGYAAEDTTGTMGRCVSCSPP
jgi:hypothetical protein